MDSEGWYLIGAPWDCSASGRGEQTGPTALRAAGLAARVGLDRGDAATVIDDRRRDESTGVLALEATVRAAHVLTESLTDALREAPGRRPLVIGGDCSILLGIIPAVRQHVGPVALWFVDGHPDYLDGQTSDTGETADMDLAVLTGVGAAELTGLNGTAPMVDASEVVLLGHRATGLDEESAEELTRLPPHLRRIDSSTVAVDPPAAGQRALAMFAGRVNGVWLHVDVDVLDPDSLPAVTYPQPGGLSWDELESLLLPLARSPRLVGMSIADFRPDLDPSGEHATRLVQLLDRVL